MYQSYLKSILKYSSIIFVLFCASALSYADESLVPKPFRGDNPESTQVIDYYGLSQFYEKTVLDMGPSSRHNVSRSVARVGTKLKKKVKVHTDGEGNRFIYESFDTQKNKALLTQLKEQLIGVPTQISLNQLNKDEQLAYWLNLYNISLISELVNIYPKRNLKDWLSGENSILEQKILTVADIPLSLNDIQFKILKNKFDSDPLIIYGLYQGNIGSPNIRKEAYTGKHVYKQLKANAFEFINSNRGTFPYSTGFQISSYYERNKDYLELSNKDLKMHLLKYAKSDVKNKLNNTSSFRANIDNWHVTDLYGTERTYGVGAPVESWDVNNDEYTLTFDNGPLSLNQKRQLQSLLKIRAVNFGGGSVTVTDLPDQIEEVEK